MVRKQGRDVEIVRDEVLWKDFCDVIKKRRTPRSSPWGIAF